MQLTREPRLQSAAASSLCDRDHAGVAARRGLRVAHIIAPGLVGGANTVVRLLATTQHAQGDRVMVLAIVGARERDHPFLDGLRAAGIEAIAIEVPRRGYAAERRRVGALLAGFAPSLVHTHGYRADVVDAPAARALGVPVVTTVHGFTGGGWKSQCYEWLQRRAFRKHDAVVAVSEALVADIAAGGVPRGRIHCVPNVFEPTMDALSRVEARIALGLPEAGYVIGWVGRLSREKGGDVFLDALARMSPSAGVTAVVIGDGPERDALERQARTSGIGGRVRFQGALPGAERYFRSFDLFALSSRTEGTPMVVLEARAAGVPVVATSVGGVPALLADSPDHLVPPEDPGALAEAMMASMNDPRPATERAIEAQRRLEAGGGLTGWWARYDSVYRRLVLPRPAE